MLCRTLIRDAKELQGSRRTSAPGRAATPTWLPYWAVRCPAWAAVSRVRALGCRAVRSRPILVDQLPADTPRSMEVTPPVAPYLISNGRLQSAHRLQSVCRSAPGSRYSICAFGSDARMRPSPNCSNRAAGDNGAERLDDTSIIVTMTVDRDVRYRYGEYRVRPAGHGG